MLGTLRGSMLVVGLCALVVAPAAAQQADEDLPVDKRGQGAGTPLGGAAEPEADVHQEGEYGGITPGKAKKDDGAKKPKKAKKPAKKAKVTWVGFQATGGGAARVFVQLSKDSEFSQSVVGDTLVVTLPGAILATKNESRFLDTSFFDTRVAKIEARRSKGKGKKPGVEVVVYFKKGGAGQADAKTDLGPDGLTYLFLDFGG